MLQKIIVFAAFIGCVSVNCFSQSLSLSEMKIDKSSKFYNSSYDDLLTQGKIGLETGKSMGSKTPGMGLIYYNRAVEINPSKPEAYDLRGQAFLLYNMLEQALESYNKGLELNPDNPALLYGVFEVSFAGSSNYDLNEIPKPVLKQIINSAAAFMAVAPATYTTQIKKAKKTSNFFKLAIDNNDAFKKYNLCNLSEATAESIKTMESLIQPIADTKNNSMLAQVYDNLIIYYSASDYAKVKDYALKALATGEARISTYYYYAKGLYYKDKNSVEAEKICNAGLKTEDNSYISSLKSTILFEEGKKGYLAKDYLKAATNFQKYVDDNPDEERALAYLSFSNYNLKKYADAATSLKKLKAAAEPATIKILYPNLDALIAFTAKPVGVAPMVQTTLTEVETQEELITKGNDLFDEKKYEESIAMLNTALKYFEPTKNPIALSRIYASIGFAYHDSKDYPKAKEYYTKSIAAGGSDSRAYNYLGLLLYAVDKKYDEGEKMLNDGLVKYPDNENLRARLSKLYMSRADEAYEKKEYNSAITDYLKSLEFHEDAEAYVFLGFSYYFTGQNEKSKEAMENAKYTNPDIVKTYPGVDQVLEKLK